jgi:hypothetical protein
MPTHAHIPARMCGASNRDGTACRRAPIRGGNRCTMHGGNSPLARMKAAETLAAAAWPAAEVLFEIIERWKEQTCPTCGLPKSDPTPVIRAAQVVLDRTGHHPSLSVHVNPQPQIPEYMAWVLSPQLEQVDVWLREAQQRMKDGLPPEDRQYLADVRGEVVEAELAEAKSEEGPILTGIKPSHCEGSRELSDRERS